jgi:hypothetical protein
MRHGGMAEKVCNMTDFSKIHLSKLLSLDDFTVWLVDGNYVRTNLEPDFTNFAQPLRFPTLVPPDELWVDQSAGKELAFYLTHMLVEYRAMAAGTPYQEAETLGAKAEARERAKVEQIGKHMPFDSQVYEYLLAWQGDVSIWIVNGERVRDTLYTDFVEGGHDLVYNFIPKKEIWIDKATPEAERVYTIAHEVFERGLMAKGMDYNSAHVKALKVEHKLRISAKEAT